MTKSFNNTISVYGYLRVSSDGQVTLGNGLNGQRGAIEDFADRNGYFVEHFYRDEGVSGKLASRKGLDEMIADLKKVNKNINNPKIKHVIVDDIDRIARDVGVRLTKKTEIESTGATIISLKQTIEDTPESRLSSTITMATKQYERENNGRRVRSRQEQRMKDGYLCFQLPLGYKYVKAPQGGGKIAVPDEPSFSIISQGLKLLANSTLPTQSALIRFLNERGVKTRSGGPINDKFMSRLINKGRLPIYAGFVDHPARGINMVKGHHKAAITEEEFYKIATKFKMREFFKDHTPNDISNNLQLRRVLHCGYCGGLLSGSATKGHGGEYFYYYCFNKNCPRFRKSINSNKINNEIEKFLGLLTLDEDYMNSLKIIVDAIWATKGETKQARIDLKEKRIEEIDREIERMVGKITETLSDIVYKVLEEKITKLDEEKKQLQVEISSFKDFTMDDYIREFDGLKAVIQCPLNIRKRTDIEGKRLLISNIFNDTLAYSKERGLRTSEIPLVYANNPNFWEKLKQNKKSQLRTISSIDETLPFQNKSSMVDYVSKTTKFQNIEKLNSELERFNSIYQYIKLKGIAL